MHKDGEPQHFFKSSKEKSVHRHEKAKDKALRAKIDERGHPDYFKERAKVKKGFEESRSISDAMSSGLKGKKHFS